MMGAKRVLQPWMGAKITAIRVEHHDEAGPREEVTFYFDQKAMPWSSREFSEGSPTRRRLNAIEDAITMFNTIEERGETGRPFDPDWRGWPHWRLILRHPIRSISVRFWADPDRKGRFQLRKKGRS